MKTKLFITVFAMFAFALAGCEKVEKHTEVCKVLSVDKQVKTSGSADGFSTDIYWLVTTDKGTYHLRTDGLWTCPEAVGKLKPDSVYNITVDGWLSSPFLGAYPFIVKVSPCREEGVVE